MDKVINILVDDSTLSQNALIGIGLAQFESLNILELSHNKLDDQVSILAGLKGSVINLLSPETFSLYRGKLYQLLASNKNISPFAFSGSASGSIARWSFLGENVTISESAKVGLSTYVGPNSVIGANASVGSFCWIGEGVVIAPGAIIGNNVTIHDGVHVGTGAKISKFNEIRHNISPNENLVSKRIETDFFDAVAYIHGA